jgi:hypothetical protein
MNLIFIIFFVGQGFTPAIRFENNKIALENYYEQVRKKWTIEKSPLLM